MANKTEYQMLWKLGAQLGKDFGGTFSSAQKILATTQKEIQELHRQQGDIQSYTRQQQSLEKSKQKLELYQQQLANVRNEMSHNSSYSSDLANKELDLQAKIGKTKDEIAVKTAKLDQMSTHLQEAGVDTKNLATESARLQDEMDTLKKAEEEAGEEAKQFGNDASSAFETVGSAIVAAGVAAALHEIYESYKECVTIAADFESTMSTVEALSGANAGEMAQLTAMAKELGATTKFTAIESAQAMTYMGMAGWDAKDMVSGMDGVLQLAAASGEDLATVSDIVTDALTAFGLSAADTAHFSDVLATAATKANTNVAMMGETFKYAAPLAGALGYTVEDVATMIGLMANSGIKASQAGTALRTMFTKLREGATLSAAAFGEYTVETQNADGTMRKLGDVISDLRTKFAEMTDAEKAANAEALVGDHAMTGFIAIMNSASADFDTLANSIENSSGAAKRMADIKMDNLSGQLTLMNSAADALKTTIGEAFAPELRGLAAIGTDILSGINEFAEKHPVLLKSIIALGAELMVLVGAYTAYTTVKKVSNTLKTVNTVLTAKETAAKVVNTGATVAQTVATEGATVAQTSLNAAMMASPIGWISAGIAVLTVGVIAVSEAIKQEEKSYKNLTAASQEQYDELQALNAEYERTCEVYGETSDEARSLHGELVLLEESYESNKQTIAEFNESIRQSKEEYQTFIAEHKKNIDAINTEEDVLLALIGKLEALEKQTNKTEQEKQAMLTLVDQLNDRLPTLGLSYDKVSDSLSSTAASMREVVLAEIARKKYEENYQAYYEAVEKELKYKKDLETATQNATKAQAEYDALINSNTRKEMLEESKHIAGEASGRAYAAKYSAFVNQLENARKKAESMKNTQDDLQKQYDEVHDMQEKLLEEMGLYTTTIQEATDATEEAIQNSGEFKKALADVRAGYLDVEQAATYYGVSAETLQGSIDDATQYQNDLASAIKAVEDGYYTASEAAEIYGVTVDAITTASSIQDTIDKIAELGEAYHEVKDAAQSSIEGQYKLWDEAAIVIATDIQTINTALETQLAYWSDYNTDLANLIARSDDIDGLGDVIATFADGSADSVNAIAGMARASDDELRKMVENWQKVKAQQEETSESLAQLETDFDDTLAIMQSDLESAIDDMNLGDESAEAAKSTIDAYIEAIRQGSKEAEAVAKRLSSLVADALQFKGTISVDVSGSVSGAALTAAQGAAQGYVTSHGLRNGDKSRWGQDPNFLPLLRALIAAGGSIDDLNGYASGTNGAASGLALVGEDGPEIVAFSGGESVYTADETKAILGEMRDLNAYANGTGADISIVSFLPALMAMYNAEQAMHTEPVTAAYRGSETVHITISPSFSIEGGTTDEIEERIRGLSDELVEMVLDAIDESGIDVKRGVYA